MLRGVVSRITRQAIFLALSTAALALLSKAWCSLFHDIGGSFWVCSISTINSGSTREHILYHSTLCGVEHPSSHGGMLVINIGGSPLLLPWCTSK